MLARSVGLLVILICVAILAVTVSVLAIPSAALMNPAGSTSFTGPTSNSTPLMLTSPNAQVDGHFGVYVAISGARMVVGAKCENVSGYSCAGRAYVFSETTGDLIFSLVSPNAQVNGYFGWSVAISGTTVVVGAGGETVGPSTSAGHVYIFNATTGALLRTLTSPNAQSNGEFGYPVAISGTTVVVGASGETVKGFTSAGRAYVFNADTGKRLYTLTSPNVQTGGSFGFSDAVSAYKVVVGAPLEKVSGITAAGHVYVFNSSTGTRITTLKSPNSQTNGKFGWTVAVNGSTVAVGAYEETASGYYEGGHVYVFNGNTGIRLYTLTSPIVQTHGEFGGSVSLTSTKLAVGANEQNNSAGNVYVYSSATGTLVASLISPNEQSGGNFGWWECVSGSNVLVGASFETASGSTYAGHAYLFKV